MTEQIYIKKINGQPWLETVGDGTQYIFDTKFNISLALVAPEHVDQILSKRKGCCGGKKKPIYTYATETDIRRWNFGGR